MVSLEELAALDLQIWLRTGAHAAHIASCNQSTISRRVDRTLRVFDLRLRRRDGAWIVQGNPLLLSMQRELHQLARFLGQDRLRLEISPLMAPLLAALSVPGWLVGRSDLIGLARPLQLLRERVIDAWLIDNSVDLPPPDDPEVARLDLFRYPLWLAAAPGHPLAGERGVSHDDLRRFPVPQIPLELFPNTARHFAGLGLAGPTLRARSYDPSDWEGRTADGVSLTYANPFNLATHPELRPLDSEPLLINGVSLVVRRDRIEQAAVHDLRRRLVGRLRSLQPRLPELQSLD
jgi:DNA-binding transcriptional LysR family regulator